MVRRCRRVVRGALRVVVRPLWRRGVLQRRVFVERRQVRVLLRRQDVRGLQDEGGMRRAMFVGREGLTVPR